MAAPRTFIDLVNCMRVESGLGGNKAEELASLFGTAANIPAWLNAAYAEIVQGNRWEFAWRTASLTVVAGNGVVDMAALYPTVTASMLQDIDYTQVRINGAKIGKADYSMIRDGAQAGTPNCFAIRPDGAMVLYPAPNIDVTLTFDYWLSDVVAMENKDDAPIIPEGMRDVIVWKALINYCANDSVGELFQYAQSKYQDRYARLVSAYSSSGMAYRLEPLA